MGLSHSLQDTNWYVSILDCLWQGMPPSCGTRVQTYVGNQAVQF